MHKKALIILADDKSSLQSYDCNKCGHTMIIAEAQPNCFHCGEALEHGDNVGSLELTASNLEKSTKVFCPTCDTTMKVLNTKKNADDLSLSAYCVSCGGEHLTASFDEDDFSRLEASDSEEDLKLEDEEEATKEALTDSSEELNAATLQWSVTSSNKYGEEATLIASSIDTGTPVLIFHKQDTPEGMQPLFATQGFVDAFVQTASDKGLGNTVKSFGGSFFKGKELISSVELEKMALERLETTALPKLIACCQTAVEGGLKGIYPDVENAITNTIVSELVASGITKDRAETAVSNTFAINGSSLFATILAKACELYTKPKAQYEEVTNMITAATGPTFQPYDAGEVATRLALNSQELLLTPPATLTASYDYTDTQRKAIKALQKELF